MSIGNIARAMGVTTVYLSRVELGKSPPLTFARTVEACRILGVDPMVLIRVHPLLGAAAAAIAAAERASVVAYIRRETYPCCSQCNNELADYIERGDHHKDDA